MIGYRDLVLRLTLWFLLTADGSWANILMGIGISCLLPTLGPRCYGAPTVLKDWLHILWEILMAIPKAYGEAVEMILHPHKYEEITQEPSKPRRTPGLIFLDIFLITFTPKSIVVKHHETGWHDVHWVKRRR